MENNLLEDRLNYHCTNQCKDYHEDGSCMKPMMCGFRTYMLATINDFHFYKKELELYKKALDIASEILEGRCRTLTGRNKTEWKEYLLKESEKE